MKRKKEVHHLQSAPTSIFVSKLEACDMLSVSMSTINRLLADGPLPFRKVGKRVLISRAGIMALDDFEKVAK